MLAVTLAACGTPSTDTPDDTDTDGVVDACAPTPLPGEAALDAADAAALQAALDAARSSLGAPGIDAAVALPDGRVWVGSSGVSDVTTQEALDDRPAFRIGSITKTYVAVVILQLVDEGVLALTDTLDAWYPQVPQAEAITLTMLLQHTSGVRDYTTTSRFIGALASQDPQPVPIDTILDDCAAAGLDFDPGTTWAYSNTNYFLLGRIAERETGQDLATLLRSRVLAPQGLDRTWLEGFEDAPACAALVPGHVGGTPGLVIDPSWQWASGGLSADVRDVLRWGLALFDGDAATPSQWAQMSTRATARDSHGDPAPYGMGLYLKPDTPCGPTTGHTGSTMGFQSDLFQTEDGTIVAVVQNDFAVEVSEAAWALCDVVE